MKFAIAAFAAANLAGCVQTMPRASSDSPVGVLELAARPAEKALLAGMRSYDEGQYADAEFQLNAALAARLSSTRDQAGAYKTLAFIYCTTRRERQCLDAFRSARRADPGFALSKSEEGHPVWGPLYDKARRAD